MKNRKSSKPLVSVCCITYNHVSFIKDAIEGFLMQKTNFPYEIIIHDDASTDGTSEIVKEYADKHPDLIVPILQRENQYWKGQMLSEYVWPRTRGKYIALCEGDDYWTDPLKLQKQFDFMEANPEYSISYHSTKVINEKGEVIQALSPNKKYRKDLSSEELIKAAIIPTCTKFFKNLTADIIKEDVSGDVILTSFLGNYGKGKYMPEIGQGVYRRHSGGVWSSRTKTEMRLGMITSRLRLYNLYIQLNKPKYIKYFTKQFNRYAYELIATTSFKSRDKITLKFLNILRDNYNILTFQNRMFYKALKRNQQNDSDIASKIFLILTRLLISLHPVILLAFIYWCKWKLSLLFKINKK